MGRDRTVKTIAKRRPERKRRKWMEVVMQNLKKKTRKKRVRTGGDGKNRKTMTEGLKMKTAYNKLKFKSFAGYRRPFINFTTIFIIMCHNRM